MDVSVKEMKLYIQDYLKLFQSNQVPKVSSIYELTVENFMNNLIHKCIDDYKLTMFRIEDIITEENIDDVHDKCKERSLEVYDNQKKMGNSEHAATFRTKLELEIDGYFVIFKDHSERNIQKLTAERAKYEALLSTERQLREQAEQTRTLIEKQLIELENARQQNQIELNDYKSQKILLETRLNRKCRKLQEFQKKLQREEKFRWILLGILGLSIAVTGGAVARAIESAELAGAALTAGTGVTVGLTGLALTESNEANETTLSTDIVPRTSIKSSTFFDKFNACVAASGDVMQLARNVTNIVEIVTTCVLNVKKQASINQ
jgi:hypothetical protein